MSNPLQLLSRQAIEAETAAAAAEDRLPFADLLSEWRAGQGSAPPPSAPIDDESVFTADDLTEERLAASEEFPIPGTAKRLWVFPVSTEDFQAMVEWSTTVSRDDEEVEETDLSRSRLRILASQQDLAVYQVSLCCRTGPTRRHRRCFSRADVPTLRKRLGYAVISSICAISNRLSGTDEPVGPGVRRFFGCTQRALASWCSASSDWGGCPPGLRAASAELLSLARRASTRGTLDSGMLSELAEIEGSLA